jgi:hypothetical protein
MSASIDALSGMEPSILDFADLSGEVLDTLALGRSHCRGEPASFVALLCHDACAHLICAALSTVSLRSRRGSEMISFSLRAEIAAKMLPRQFDPRLKEIKNIES